jgi:hypothetical protein
LNYPLFYSNLNSTGEFKLLSIIDYSKELSFVNDSSLSFMHHFLGTNVSSSYQYVAPSNENVIIPFVVGDIAFFPAHEPHTELTIERVEQLLSSQYISPGTRRYLIDTWLTLKNAINPPLSFFTIMEELRVLLNR